MHAQAGILFVCASAQNTRAHREVLDKVFRLVAQLAIEDELSTPLQQQQLIKCLEDVNAGLVDGADNGPPCVHYVAHCAHHNGCCPRIKPCTQSASKFWGF